MKRLTMIAAVGAVALPLVSQANVININITHGDNYTGTAIAEDEGTVWNEVDIGGRPTSITVSDMSDSDGVTQSGVDVTLAGVDGASINRYNDTGSFSPSPLNLMSGYSYGAEYDVTISGLEAGSYYKVYAYLCGNNEGQGGGLAIASANGGSGIDSYAYVTATGASFRDIYSGGGEGVSYLVDTAVVDENGDLSMRVDTYANGFQIEAIPEPATIGLIGLSGIGLLFVRHRFKI